MLKERELELLKRDNGLMSAQLEQCERHHSQRYAALEKQTQAEATRLADEIARRDTDIKELKAKNKQRKAKLQERDHALQEAKAHIDQLAQ